MAAEKHYSNTLKALGISDEFVSKKGQSGKIFDTDWGLKTTEFYCLMVLKARLQDQGVGRVGSL